MASFVAATGLPQSSHHSLVIDQLPCGTNELVAGFGIFKRSTVSGERNVSPVVAIDCNGPLSIISDVSPVGGNGGGVVCDNPSNIVAIGKTLPGNRTTSAIGHLRSARGGVASVMSVVVHVGDRRPYARHRASDADEIT